MKFLFRYHGHVSTKELWQIIGVCIMILAHRGGKRVYKGIMNTLTKIDKWLQRKILNRKLYS